MFKKAERKSVFLKMAMQGPTGCLHEDTIIHINMGGCSRQYTISKLYRSWIRDGSNGGRKRKNANAKNNNFEKADNEKYKFDIISYEK